MLPGRAGDRGDDGELIHHGRDFGKHLADLDAGDVGRNRLELAADLGRSLGLDFPHILVRRSPPAEDIYDSPVRSPASRGPPRAQDIGKGKARWPPAAPTSFEE